MKPSNRPITKLVTLVHDNRTLEAEVDYIITTVAEPREYGSTTSYETLTTFTVAMVDYLTPEMTVEERAALDLKINEGPYE